MQTSARQIAPKSRTSAQVDTARKIIVFRIISEAGAEVDLQFARDTILSLEDAETYDMVYDLRRHEAMVALGELKYHGEFWKDQFENRDVGRASVIVSKDSIIQSRQQFYQELYPSRRVYLCLTMDEAFEFLRL